MRSLLQPSPWEGAPRRPPCCPPTAPPAGGVGAGCDDGAGTEQAGGGRAGVRCWASFSLPWALRLQVSVELCPPRGKSRFGAQHRAGDPRFYTLYIYSFI